MADKLFNTAISFSSDPRIAAYEAVTRAIAFSGKRPKLGLLFCSRKKYGERLPELVKAANEIFKQSNPHCEWIGCANENIDGCMAFVLSDKRISPSIGLGSATHRNPLLSGKRAAQNAISHANLSEAITAYVSAAAIGNKMPKLEQLQPYLAMAFFPENSDQKAIFDGLRSSVAPTVPILKFTGYLFSNGVILNNTTLFLLQAFEEPGDWHYQNLETFSRILD